MLHPGVTIGVLATTVLLLYALLQECPGVVQRPEPGGGGLSLLWQAYHKSLADTITTAEAGQGLDLVFYGDSITENWLGTSLGRPWPGGKGVAAVYQKHFGGYKSAVLANAGDQTAHLWWRLLHGEVPLPTAVHQGKAPHVAVVLIGTNDLGAADCHRNATELLAAAPGIVQRVSAVMGVLQTALPRTHLILQALLPRGMDLLPFLRFRWPNRGTAALAEVNAKFQAMADEHGGKYFIDCGLPFLEQSAGKMSLAQGLMPDGLHPNAAGMELMAKCLEPRIAQLMGQPVTDFSAARGLLDGDQTANLWWRLQHGELPQAAKQGPVSFHGKAPRVAMVMIGTNDLGAADCHHNAAGLLAAVPGIMLRIAGILRELRTAMPHTHIVLQALLPRGMTQLPLLRFRWPNRSTVALAAVNSRLKAMADEHAGVHFIDCGQPFIQHSTGRTSIAQELMPDGLHPNAAGNDIMAGCLEPLIAQLAALPVSDFSATRRLLDSQAPLPSAPAPAPAPASRLRT